MLNERHIEDTLNDIKKIISSYFDTIDYSDYIETVKNILKNIAKEKKNITDPALRARINELEARSQLYLKKMTSLQSHYEHQEWPENA